MWNIDPDSHRSVRNPGFFGPMVLAAALLFVSFLSDPWTNQFHLLIAHGQNTTLTIGEWGACVRLDNTSGVTGKTSWCTSTMSGFAVNINLNSTNAFTNWPEVEDDAQILGTTTYSDTTSTVPILSSGQTSFVWLHVLAWVCGMLTIASLVVPPRWIGGGKTGLANFQRSGILTLILGAITWVLALAAFFCLLTVVLHGRSQLNSINGIHATWGNAIWFLLPCTIVMIPAYLVILLPVYVPPKDAEAEPLQSVRPIDPLFQQKAGSTSSFPGTPLSHK